MTKVTIENLKISSILLDFINNEVIPGTGIESKKFWGGFDKAVHELAVLNKNLIDKREIIQKKIDDWHKSNRTQVFDQEKYVNFLKSIDYIIEEKQDFKIEGGIVSKFHFAKQPQSKINIT